MASARRRVRRWDPNKWKCVSKLVCSLIDSPDFIRRYLADSLKAPTCLFLILRNNHLYTVKLDSLNTTQKIQYLLDQ
ncbi:hypothetical protein COLO4_13002 [Corchorus olitorius]|uniref:Uncharacterized protein n=1 Tax=Corchorus olitorius TaxID=93759 RepID=A0A1R3JYT3_9ROSI|nr:hypothetical protein COLO4_13002 [Corchorus olitorius]